jgi:hypothetical protein
MAAADTSNSAATERVVAACARFYSVPRGAGQTTVDLHAYERRRLAATVPGGEDAGELERAEVAALVRLGL